MKKTQRWLSLILAVVVTLMLGIAQKPVKTSAIETVLLKLQIVTQPKTEYFAGERVTMQVNVPNYKERVQYRAILWDGQRKIQKDLWTSFPGYFYTDWMPKGPSIFTIGFPIMEPGIYSITVLVRKAGSKSNYESFIKTNSFAVKTKDIVLNKDGEVYGPKDGLQPETVVQDIYITANNVTVRNVDIKGTLFVDPGKDGSVNIENVIAKKIVVLSGGQNSIHLKNTNADTMEVSSDDGKVRVEATGTTTIGSTIVTSYTVFDSNGARLGTIYVRESENGEYTVELDGTFNEPIIVETGATIKALEGSTVSNVVIAPDDEKSAIELVGEFKHVSVTKKSEVIVGEDSNITDSLDVKTTAAVKSEKGSNVSKLIIDTDNENDSITLEGSFNEVELNTKSNVTIAEGSRVSNMEILTDAKVTIEKDAVIENLDKNNNKVDIEGQGTITSNQNDKREPNTPPENNSPSAGSDTVSVDEDGSVLVDVLANDSDIDGDPLSISSFSQGGHGKTVKEGNSIRYTPEANYNGTDSFTYTISDGRGKKDTATVNIKINPVNDVPTADNDMITLDEDGSIVADVLANDLDIDGDTMTITSFTQGGHGAVSKEGSGLKYTPSTNYNGTDSFTYTIDDGNGGIVTAAVNITIKPVNDKPLVMSETTELSEDMNVLIDVLSNDSDVEGDTLSVTGFTQGNHGTVLQEGNSLRYTPAVNYNGTDSFTYDVSDGKGGVSTGIVNITVKPVNDIPIANNDTVTINEDTAALIDVLNNDMDDDGDKLVIDSLIQGAHGTVTKDGNCLKYTPAGNYNGFDSFTYKISDGNGGSAEATVSITIKAINDVPCAVSDTAEFSEDESVLINVLANDSDIEGDTLTIDSFTQGNHGVVSGEGSSLRYTPAANYYGSDNFSYTINDGNGGTATASVSIKVNSVNDVPIVNNDAAVVNEDDTVLINILSNDLDIDGDTLTIGSFTQGVHGTVLKEGNSLRYTPTANYNGTDSFTYQVNDGNGGAASATVNVTVNSVNDTPVVINDTVTFNEDETILISVLANDSDVEGDTLTITSFTQGGHGVVVKEGNSLRYTPAANYYGKDAFTYEVSDGNGGVATGTVNVTINLVNDAPVAVNDSVTIVEDTNVLIGVVANDSDIDGDILVIKSFTQGAHGTVSKEGNYLRYTPAPNYHGSDSFDYTIDDGNGGKASAVVNIAIDSINDAPIANTDTSVVNEDGDVLIDVLVNDSDVEGDPITITSFTQGNHGNVVKEGNRLRYTPVTNYNGSDTFTYEVSDGNGGVATGTVNVTINPVNDAPLAANDSVTVDEDDNALIDVLNNDSDVDGDTLKIVGFTQGTHGTISKEGSSLRYTPAANYYGVDSFTYQVSDENGGTATATVNVTVNSVNDAPVVINDTVTFNEDETILISVLVNDSDVEGDILTITSFTQGSHGVVAKEGNSLRYTPTANYNGTDTFTYEVDDGKGGKATGNVNITVTPVNDLPVAVNDSVTINEDTNILIDVVANDSDVDGDVLAISQTGKAGHGTIVIAGTKISYTPEANYNGVDSFTYEVSDGNGGTATAIVNMVIEPVNDAPAAVDDSAEVKEDGTVLVNVLGNDTDVEKDTLTITSFTQGSHGTVLQEGNSLRYTPAVKYNGNDSFTYIISDGHGGISTAVVTVNIIPNNLPPVANSDNAVLLEDTNLLINVLENDTDVDNDPLTITSFTQGNHGTVSLEGNSLRYTPAANYNGSDTFTYEMNDGNGGKATGNVNITVTPVNDIPVANSDSVAVNEDANILIDVVANDLDVDGDYLTILSFTQGEHGTVEKAGNSLRYTPSANYYGTDSFTYVATDGIEKALSATVSITINSVNDAPTANNDSAEVKEDETTLVDVVANDTDIDGDTLVISSVTQGSHGMVSKEGNSIRYTPDAGYNGSDSFTYTISDGHGGISTATVNMTVKSTGPIVLLSIDFAIPSYKTGKIPFTVTQAGNYKLQTSYYVTDCDTVLYLFDAAETMIAVNDDYTDLYSCIIMWLEPGDYFVSVEEINTNSVYCHLEVSSI